MLVRTNLVAEQRTVHTKFPVPANPFITTRPPMLDG